MSTGNLICVRDFLWDFVEYTQVPEVFYQLFAEDIKINIPQIRGVATTVKIKSTLDRLETVLSNHGFYSAWDMGSKGQDINKELDQVSVRDLLLNDANYGTLIFMVCYTLCGSNVDDFEKIKREVKLIL